MKVFGKQVFGRLLYDRWHRFLLTAFRVMIHFSWLMVMLLLIPQVIVAQNSLEPSEVNGEIEERWFAVSDTLRLDDLLDVAVKFFPVVGIDDDGRLSGQLCVVASDHASMHEHRDKKLESFCAGVIFSHAQDGVYDLYDEYMKGLKQVASMNLGLDREERLLRAQGALYMFMKMNVKLREVFLYEYRKQRHLLHFLLLPPQVVEEEPNQNGSE